MKNFGIMSYNSINIGDEIQSIAASRFLPQIDSFVNRERLSLFRDSQGPREIKLIMNAWYMWRPTKFVPPSFVRPLLISMCIGKRIQKAHFLNSKTKRFLLDNGPVGCRDMRSLEYLNQNEIPAYFSGCLTSTLLGGKRDPQNYVLCLDVDEEIVNYVKRESKCPVYDLTKLFSPYINSKNRFKLAKAVLYAYKNAKAIVTTNFHTALPAMAFGTPCCLIKPNGDGGDFDGRMMGYEKIINFYSKEEFLTGGVFNINNPAPVVLSDEFIEMKRGLEEKCASFTGYDSKKPIFEDDYNPFLELLECLKYDKKDVDRVLMYASRRSLLKTTVKRFLGNNYLDLKR